MSITMVAGSPTVPLGGSDQLTVTMVDDDGNPVAGARVSLSLSAGNWSLPTVGITGPDGSFAVDLFAGNQAGSVTVSATFGSDFVPRSKPGYSHRRWHVANHTDRYGRG